MAELDTLTDTPMRDALARLGRERDLLAKSWLVHLPAARIGGDEVCVLAPDQTATDMSALATRLVDSVTAESEQPGQAGVDVAIGVAACPEHGDDVEYLLAAADQAMYRAKAEGEPYVLAAPAAEIKVQRTR